MEESSSRLSPEVEMLRPRTAAEAVAAQLRLEIQSGERPPGTPLRQNDVAARYGVSTTPVREAFALLQADGLVRIDRYRGAVVFMPTVDDLRDAYEVREALELLAVAKATKNITAEQLEELAALLDTMRGLDDVPRWLDLNEAFHMNIYDAADSPRLSALIASQRDACSMYIRMHVSHEPHREVMDEQHDQILTAVRDRNVKAAQKAVKVHLEHSMSQILSLIDELERSKSAAGKGARAATAAG
jgi:DNA-binding GntR family transcriptional regulator